MPLSSQPPGSNRRSYERFEASLQVDYTHGENFLFSYVCNISEMGIFIYSKTPLSVGTRLRVRFSPPGEDSFEMQGQVAWVNPVKDASDDINPGMGVRFLEMSADQRERVVELIHTIAYLDGDVHKP